MAYQYKTTKELEHKELQITRVHTKHTGTTIYGFLVETSEQFKHEFGPLSRPALVAQAMANNVPFGAKIIRRGIYTDLKIL